MNKPRHWATTFAFVWLLTAALHTVVLYRFADSTELSTVFAGLTRLSPASFVILGSFVALRLFVMLLAPAALVSAGAWLLDTRRTRALRKAH